MTPRMTMTIPMFTIFALTGHVNTLERHRSLWFRRVVIESSVSSSSDGAARTGTYKQPFCCPDLGAILRRRHAGIPSLQSR
jgi:hypothetical protein